MSEWHRNPPTMHQRRGDGRYAGAGVRANARGEGMAGYGKGMAGGERGAGERAERRQSRPRPTHPASPMVLRKCIGGEEVAATFRDTEDFSPRALCLCRYAPPDTYSTFFFFACLYLSVKKEIV